MHSTAPTQNASEERRKAVAFAVELLEWLFPVAFGIVLLMIAAALFG